MGALTWKQPEMTIVEKSAVEKVSFTFHAVNSGDVPITITKIDKSCGCTSVTPSKQTIEPGGAVDVAGEIALAAGGGKHVKTITVNTDDKQSKILSVNIETPEMFKVSATSLLWENTLAPKTLTITIPESSAAKYVGLESLSPDFVASEKEVVPQREYQITVTPKTKDAKRTAIKFLFSSPKLAPLYVVLSVKGANAEPGVLTPDMAKPRETTPAASAPLPHKQAVADTRKAVLPSAPTRMETLLRIEKEQVTLLREIQRLIAEDSKMPR